jgi:hypothetical protein
LDAFDILNKFNKNKRPKITKELLKALREQKELRDASLATRSLVRKRLYPGK